MCLPNCQVCKHISKNGKILSSSLSMRTTSLVGPAQGAAGNKASAFLIRVFRILRRSRALRRGGVPGIWKIVGGGGGGGEGEERGVGVGECTVPWVCTLSLLPPLPSPTHTPPSPPPPSPRSPSPLPHIRRTQQASLAQPPTPHELWSRRRRLPSNRPRPL